MADDKPIGLGIAGLGMAGAVMVRAVASHPGFRLAAAAEPQAAPRLAFTWDFKAGIHSDIRGLCDDRTVDAIYIATPHQFHAEHARLAAAAGKHIILEKPMALTLADCDAIMAAVCKLQDHGETAKVVPDRKLISPGKADAM